jgi:uncharacterized hydrophobic protein (TIGR00271 family)
MDLVTHRQQEIAAAAAIDFVFFTYITTASCIAAAGLVTDNSEVIVASMLISPIMNHVNAVSFGVLLRDPGLVRRGCVGIGVGTFIGAAVGVLTGLYFSATMVLTNEMLVRTAVLSLQWSLLVAFFSALAAGVSVLHAQTGNLVGVAISTSVLPPIVNFGLLLPNALQERPNSVPVHACLLSAGMALGNILVIMASSVAIIHVYVRMPSWRPRADAILPPEVPL